MLCQDLQEWLAAVKAHIPASYKNHLVHRKYLKFQMENLHYQNRVLPFRLSITALHQIPGSGSSLEKAKYPDVVVFWILAYVRDSPEHMTNPMHQILLLFTGGGLKVNIQKLILAFTCKMQSSLNFCNMSFPALTQHRIPDFIYIVCRGGWNLYLPKNHNRYKGTGPTELQLSLAFERKARR